MEEVCDALEREFKRVSNDLEFVQHRLEAELRSSPSSVDAMSIFRRLQAVEVKLLMVKEKATALAIEKQKFLSISQLGTLETDHNALKSAMIRSSCGSAQQQNIGEIAGVEQKTESMGPAEAELEAGGTDTKAAPKRKVRKSLDKKTPNTRSNPTNQDNSVPALDFLKCVPEHKFLQLPESTRGRATHADVVHAYRQLVDFVKANTVAPQVEAAMLRGHRSSRRKSVTGASRRQSVGAGVRLQLPEELPAMEYSIRELANGALASSNPFQMDRKPAGKQSKMAIKLTGKTGSNILLSLRALGLVKTDASSSVRENLTVVLTDDLETELLGYRQQIASGDNKAVL